jgi:hypothetical protein
MIIVMHNLFLKPDQPLYLRVGDSVTIVNEAGWVSRLIWTFKEISPPMGFKTGTESLYGHSYLDHRMFYAKVI